MTPTPSRSSALVAELERVPGHLSRLLGLAERRQAAALRGLARSGDVAAALPVLAFALGAGNALRAQALDTLDALVRGASPRTLAALDARARRRTSAPGRTGDAVTVAAVEALEDGRTAALGVAALHRDGRVREAAVRRLARDPDPLALAFLLLRASDPVAPVRDAARDALEARLAAGPVDAFVPFLSLAFRLDAVQRTGAAGVARTVRAALASPGGEAALRAGCADPDRAVRRRCVALALEARAADLRPLLRAALRDPDPMVAGLAAGEVARAFDGEDLPGLALEMASSPIPRVRLAALELLADRFAAEARAVRERLLLDPHPRVRAAAAAAALRAEPGFDAASAQRRGLASPSRRVLVGAIGALRDAGGAADAAVLAPLLEHPRPRVRLAALCAVAQLDLAGHRDAALRALSDPSPRVTRAARGLLRQGPPVDPSHLIRTAMDGRFPHERRAALDLMRAHEHWTAGLLLLRVAAVGPDDVAPRAEAALAGWHGRFHRVYAAPTAEQLTQYHVIAYALGRRSIGVSLRAILPAMERRVHAAAVTPAAAGGTVTDPAGTAR